MLLLWSVRCLDRTKNNVGDRYLLLCTESLDPTTRAAIEIVTADRGSGESLRGVLRFRHLFQEKTLEEISEISKEAVSTKSFGINYYIEDEEGNEIPFNSVFQSQKSDMAEEPQADPGPIPLEDVTLTQEQVNLFGLFVRDLQELIDSTFMRERPGTLTKRDNQEPTFDTALTDEEIRSFVTVYRRFHLENEPANLNKTVALFRRYVRGHPFSNLVGNLGAEYRNHLKSPCNVFPTFHEKTCNITSGHLIEVYIYTQYSHQPSKEREREFNECLGEVHGNHGHLAWIFLVELWNSSIHIIKVGRLIEDWFRRYCKHHCVTPVVLDSMRNQNIGFGALEKEDQRNARIFFEKMQKLAFELSALSGILCIPASGDLVSHTR